MTLNAFRCGDFYAKYRDDAAICAALKLGSMPAVYGYKCGHAPAVGLQYETWRPLLLGQLTESAAFRRSWPSSPTRATIRRARWNSARSRNDLGADHPVARICRRMHEANKMPPDVRTALFDLVTQTNAKLPRPTNPPCGDTPTRC